MIRKTISYRLEYVEIVNFLKCISQPYFCAVIQIADDNKKEYNLHMIKKILEFGGNKITACIAEYSDEIKENAIKIATDMTMDEFNDNIKRLKGVKFEIDITKFDSLLNHNPLCLKSMDDYNLSPKKVLGKALESLREGMGI